MVTIKIFFIHQRKIIHTMSDFSDLNDSDNKENEKICINSIFKLICFIELLSMLEEKKCSVSLRIAISKIKENFSGLKKEFDCKYAMNLLVELESSKNKFVTKYQETRHLVARDDQKKFFKDNSDRFDSNWSSVHDTLQSMINFRNNEICKGFLLAESQGSLYIPKDLINLIIEFIY